MDRTRGVLDYLASDVRSQAHGGSREAALCVPQRPRAGHKNQSGPMPDLLAELKAPYGRSQRFSLVTNDAALREDRRRPAWSRHPQGSLAVAALRMMAPCILAAARKLSRFGHTQEIPSWGQVAERFLVERCGSILKTKAFDAVCARPGVGLLQTPDAKRPQHPSGQRQR